MALNNESEFAKIDHEPIMVIILFYKGSHRCDEIWACMKGLKFIQIILQNIYFSFLYFMFLTKKCNPKNREYF